MELCRVYSTIISELKLEINNRKSQKICKCLEINQYIVQRGCLIYFIINYKIYGTEWNGNTVYQNMQDLAKAVQTGKYTALNIYP